MSKILRLNLRSSWMLQVPNSLLTANLELTSINNTAGALQLQGHIRGCSQSQNNTEESAGGQANRRFTKGEWGDLRQATLQNKLRQRYVSHCPEYPGRASPGVFT